MSGKKLRFVASLVVVGLVALVFLQATAVDQVEQSVRARPDADSLVLYDGTQMKMSHFLLEYLIPEQSHFWERPFYAATRNARWLVLYALCGLAGGIAAYWLELSGMRPRTGHAPVRLGLSVFAGFLLWLLLWLPGPLLARLLVGADAAGDIGRLYPSLVAFAVLAGLFLNIFFDRLQKFFEGSFGGPGGKT